MTLLVLNLRVPVVEAVHSEPDLWRALVAFSPRFIMYVMSFSTLGIFWVGQQPSALAKNDPFALSKSDPHEEQDLAQCKRMRSTIIHAEGV